MRSLVLRGWPRRAAGLAAAFTLLTPAARAADPAPAAAFTPARAGAAEYGQAPSPGCPRAGAFKALEFELGRVAKKGGRAAPQGDDRLCAAAAGLLAWDPARGEPGPDVVRFLSYTFGLPSPARRVLVLDLPTEDSTELAQALLQPVAEALGAAAQPRFGMATQRVKPTGARERAIKGATRVALVLDDPALEVKGLPRRLEAGQAATLEGKLLAPYRSPRVAVSDVRGRIARPEPAGDAFSAQVTCGDQPGDVWIEVQAERDGRTFPVAAFPVACAKELPASLASAGAPWPADAAGQEQRLAEGINAQRQAVGLGRVEWDDRVAGVARTVAETLRDQLARGESAGVDLGALLTRAGVSSGLVLQNPAQARSAEDAEQRFTASPTNRENLLHPEVNRIGVGLAPGKDAAGKPAVLVVELFTKALAQVDPEAVRRDLYAAVEKRRSEAGAVAAKVDPKLEKVAQQYAEALAQAGGKLSQDDASEITQGIRIAYKSIDLLEGAKTNPLDFAADPTVVSPGTALGLGVAQGDNAVLGKNAVYVTLVVATPRVAEAKPAGKAKAAPKKK